MTGEYQFKKAGQQARAPGHQNRVHRADRDVLRSRQPPRVHIAGQGAGQARRDDRPH